MEDGSQPSLLVGRTVTRKPEGKGPFLTGHWEPVSFSRPGLQQSLNSRFHQPHLGPLPRSCVWMEGVCPLETQLNKQIPGLYGYFSAINPSQHTLGVSR